MPEVLHPLPGTPYGGVGAERLEAGDRRRAGRRRSRSRGAPERRSSRIRAGPSASAAATWSPASQVAQGSGAGRRRGRRTEQTPLPHAEPGVLVVLHGRDRGPGSAARSSTAAASSPASQWASARARRVHGHPLGLVDPVRGLDRGIEHLERVTARPRRARTRPRVTCEVSRLTGLASVASTRSARAAASSHRPRSSSADRAVAAQAGAVRRDVALVAVGDAVAPEALALGEPELLQEERVGVGVGPSGLGLGAGLEPEPQRLEHRAGPVAPRRGSSPAATLLSTSLRSTGSPSRSAICVGTLEQCEAGLRVVGPAVEGIAPSRSRRARDRRRAARAARSRARISATDSGPRHSRQ